MAENSDPKVGLRLRTLREKQGLSLRALVKRCGLSINAISLIERGENSPTVATLQRLAIGLNVPITDFFQNGDKPTVVYSKRDMGLRSQSDGAAMESLGIGLFDQHLDPFRMTIGPGAGDVNKPISHSGEEFIHCLEGEIEYSIGDRNFKLEQGDSLLFDAAQPHAYHNPTLTPTTILLVFQASQDLYRVQRLHMS